MTISIGATVLTDCTVSAMEILSIADTALYQAKTKGRNQTALLTQGIKVPANAGQDGSRRARSRLGEVVSGMADRVEAGQNADRSAGK